MVKHKNTKKQERTVAKGFSQSSNRPANIGPDTKYEACKTRMTAFGGMLGLIKFLDFVNFKEVFDKHYHSPNRRPRLGCYNMVLGFLMLLFIGFSRLGHFAYIRQDGIICGILHVSLLPAVSTFWRYLRSLTLNHSECFLTISAVLRSRIWQACELGYTTICIDIDTTVSTVYGDIEGSCKGHNTKNRGKKGMRPGFLFIEETREYLCGTQRRGTTMSDEEIAKLIASIGKYLPTTVKHVIIRGDAEFIGAKTVAMCRTCGYDFIFGNKRCKPNFEDKNWYTHGSYDYNEALYKPTGWDKSCRFVVMRILKEKDGGSNTDTPEQLDLFGEKKYKYRVFATSLSWKVHTVIKKYDKRADVENLIGESQREGILAIPSKRFLSNHAYFQIVMLAYNIWRWMKILSGYRQEPEQTNETDVVVKDVNVDYEIVDHTIRIARLKMLFVPAKITYSGRYDKVMYSSHDERTAGLMDFLMYLDRRRQSEVDWLDNVLLNKYRIAA